MRLERWGQLSGTVLECDKLIIPVHLGCHWTCAVISLRDRGISYFDSLGVSRTSCFVASYASVVNVSTRRRVATTFLIDTKRQNLTVQGNMGKSETLRSACGWSMTTICTWHALMSMWGMESCGPLVPGLTKLHLLDMILAWCHFIDMACDIHVSVPELQLLNASR